MMMILMTLITSQKNKHKNNNDANIDGIIMMKMMMVKIKPLTGI